MIEFSLKRRKNVNLHWSRRPLFCHSLRRVVVLLQLTHFRPPLLPLKQTQELSCLCNFFAISPLAHCVRSSVTLRNFMFVKLCSNSFLQLDEIFYFRHRHFVTFFSLFSRPPPECVVCLILMLKRERSNRVRAMRGMRFVACSCGGGQSTCAQCNHRVLFLRNPL